MKRNKKNFMKEARTRVLMVFWICILGITSVTMAYPLEEELESIYDNRSGTFITFTYYEQPFSQTLKAEVFNEGIKEGINEGSPSLFKSLSEEVGPEGFYPARWIQGQSNPGVVSFPRENLRKTEGEEESHGIVLRKDPAEGTEIIDVMDRSFEEQERFPVLDEVNDYLYIQGDTLEGWVHKEGVQRKGIMEELSLSTVKINAGAVNFRQEPSIQGRVLGRIGSGEEYELLSVQGDWARIIKGHEIGWVHRAYTEEQPAKIPEGMYQFLQLVSPLPAGITEEEIDQLFQRRMGEGDLPKDMGKAFLEAGEVTGVNEIYLVALALNNYDQSREELYQGVVVDRVAGSSVEPKTVFNFFGIGALERAPLESEAKTAYEKGWFTVEESIIGGAQWIMKNRIRGVNSQDEDREGSLDTLHKILVGSLVEITREGLLDEDSMVREGTVIKELEPILEDTLGEHREIRGWMKDIYEAFGLENRRFNIPVFEKEWFWPVPGYQRISSDFGYRKDPFEGDIRFHLGIDIPAPTGTPVVAVKSGVVTKSFRGESYGYWLEIDHGEGLSTRYAHNAKNLVTPGTHVEKGEMIARVGSTGRSTGPHLHFEVRRNNRALDPLPWMMDQKYER